uniref:DnaJ (Hsp40) homolog, subfamily C, member 24 n=1 Tax=Callorhinchus milii TaxID=7868 RepID=A0A4W3JNL4_CALMI
MTTANFFQKNWYEILGAHPSDSQQELKQNYQKLVLLYHPDKQSADVPAGELEERVQRFIEVDQAWKILGNEETKREYDLQRREVTLAQKWPVDAEVSLDEMSWIDGKDECQSKLYFGGREIINNHTFIYNVDSIKVLSVSSGQSNMNNAKHLSFLADECYIYDCRCGGEFILAKEEAEENISVICCNTCSLSIEILKRS